MSLENQLSKKIYHETYTEGHEEVHPVQLLGNMLQHEHMGDVSHIRFAQGEVYFLYKDYEAAIFKWENIGNELEQWAKKNMADAYVEMGLLPTALDLYKKIKTDSLVLNVEVSLQLFSLYIEQGKHDLAVNAIKKAVMLDADYQNIAFIASAFFEEHGDWNNAIELAVNESIRTQSVKWFDIVKGYIDGGYTARFQPDYFNEVLIMIYGINPVYFEQFVLSLWKSYSLNNERILWIQNFNELFLTLEANQAHNWSELSELYKETYFELIAGDYKIKEISKVVPDLLTNWLKITGQNHILYASAAVLAWNEIFPSSLQASIVHDAESLVYENRTFANGLEESLQLQEDIKQWARKNDIEAGSKLNWMAQELLDLNVHHMMVAGASGTGKSSFINSVLGENILSEETSSIVMVKDAPHTEINEIADTENNGAILESDPYEILSEKYGMQHDSTCVEYKLPSSFLDKYGVAFLDTPGFGGRSTSRSDVSDFLCLADSLLFVLSANAPFTEHELEILLKIREQEPDLPVHFLLNKMDTIYDETEAERVADETLSRIQPFFPEAKLYAFSSHYKNSQQAVDFGDFLSADIVNTQVTTDRTEKLLLFIKKTISHLLNKRVEREQGLNHSITWNEEMVTKLNGAIHQLDDLEKDKMQAIQKHFRVLRKELEREMAADIPKLLQECSKLIREDSDFTRIHLELNDEMNRRIQAYMEEKLLPSYYLTLMDWITSSERELFESQTYLNEMSEGFNTLFKEERIQLPCDFKIIEDWKRDSERMTSGAPIGKINILLRHTPSQLLLKGAGKLFGAISQNKTMLYNRYTQFIANDSYEETTEEIIEKFMVSFEMFEKALERDIALFFRHPMLALEEQVKLTKQEINVKQDLLAEMKNRVDVFNEAVTLFELRLRQYEWMIIG
ncbi:dynamin family protein [Metabacillus sp. RGM 3146]|uniref:dynamin family protein n=1 Tax=Metabacillus sp. RGM 3146 TaxID=3401092 RepID=UPI003B9BF5CC